MKSDEKSAARRGWLVRGGAVGLGFLITLACSAGGAGGSGVGTGGDGGSSSGGSSGNSGNGGSGADGFGGNLIGGTSNGGNGGSGLEDGGECFAETKTASNTVRPVDIIWALDNSGSMTAEAKEVQDNMNLFAGAILTQGIDVHVVVISESGPPGGFPPKNGVCIPSPLGSGTCPADTNLPTYARIDDSVASSNSLDKLLEHYPTYKPVLRQNASKYFAVVTDDNSAMSAQTFIDSVNNLDPGWFDSWRFFGVYCTGSCSNAFACASTGTVYTELTNYSGTTPGDLCVGQSNFSGVFSALAKAVVDGTQLDCQWEIPAPPPGQEFDSKKVNVKYTPSGGGGAQEIYYVPSAADCGAQGGWYYDNPQNPTKILVCPDTCDQLSGDLNGKVDIAFGCARVEVPR
ncbi:MAG: hypothetical protein KC766_04585 [Myxococcales bacterium]|nr:hypothetical protein [Myxococcales bacterium]